jgi:hypothetical protein
MAKPIQAFRRNISRARGHFRVHQALHGKRGKPTREVSDVLRGALTLTLGALDALCTDSIAEAIPPLARAGRLGKKVTDFVRENPGAVIGALTDHDPAKRLAGSIDKSKLEWATHMRPAAIDQALKGYIGVTMDWDAVAADCNASGVGNVHNWSASRVRKRLEEFVLRRNQIVHEGDLLDGSLRARGIRLDYVREAVDLVECVGCQLNKAVNKAIP